MTDATPPPLTPADSDLAGFNFMPLDVVRFAQSDLVAFAPAEAIVAAILLWGAAWQARPAGSLTNDDRALAKAAGYGRSVDEFRKVKDDALRGFVLCSDGRLYHPVVAEKVNEAWRGRLKQRWRTYCSAIRMHNSRNAEDQREAPTFDAWLEHGRPDRVSGRCAQQLPMDLGEPRVGAPAREQGSGQEPENNQAGDVARNSPDMLRATEGDVARINGGKGQGQGQGQYKDNLQPTESRATAVDDDEPLDLVGLSSRFCTAGGVAFSSPTKIAEAVELVKSWLEIGATPDEIETAIARALANTSEQRIGSLRFYDGAVRMAHARGKPKAKAAAKPAQPLPPWDRKDDPKAKPLRDALPTILGARSANAWLPPERVALEVNGRAVTLVCRSSFERQWADANAVEHIRRALPAVLGPQFTQVHTEVRP